MNIRQQIERAMKKKVYENHDKLVRATALLTMQHITMGTPVDTGRARLNWNASRNVVDGSTTVSVDPQATGTMKMLEALTGYKAGDTMYVSNNLPYIVRLNEGYSKQAPANFVEAGAMLAKRQAKEVAKKDFNR